MSKGAKGEWTEGKRKKISPGVFLVYIICVSPNLLIYTGFIVWPLSQESTVRS